MPALDRCYTQHDAIMAAPFTIHVTGVAGAANNNAPRSQLQHIPTIQDTRNTLENPPVSAKDYSINPNLLVNRVRSFYKYYDLDPFIHDRDKLYLKFMEALGLSERAAFERLDDLKEFVEGRLLPNPTSDFSAASSDRPLALPATAPRTYRPREGIENYLREVWLPYVGPHAVLTRPALKHLDIAAYYALNNFLKGGRKLPDELDVPDRSSAIDREIASTPPEEIKRHRRIEEAARRRKRSDEI